MESLEAALQYAANGFRVLPLKAGTKVPDLRNWPSEATTDPAAIIEYWDTSVRRAKGAHPNVGIACGAGLAVLDLDNPDGDPPEWVPETLTARTPSGGRHFYLAVDRPVPNSVKRLRHDIDVRGDGGQVAAPPSHITSAGDLLDRAYEWVHVAPIARVDADLLIPEDLKLNAEGRRVSFEYRDEVPVGQRNNYLTSLAGYLYAQGESESEVLAGLEQEAAALGFAPTRERELEKIARSVGRYHRG